MPAAGILDVLDNYAFVRTSGYLPGTEDVYVSLSMVRKYGLRRGDAIVGQVRQPREGERREKFNPMVRIDAVNGADPDSSKHRLEFEKLTPLYPTERLRLETGPDNLIGRVIDIAAPIGKGQRGLIVSPAKAGKTMILKSIASSITQNNPECHLMVVLVDERPEEVTDFERSVKGEVIASTFDHPPIDHTGVAELAIERAKRLVELGHDVVVLLDGITRLGRAYNLANPASGRILSGGVDSAALYPPKRFFGAARNIENGGSLTILATALIESDSRMDEVIFEEFKGTGNMEIRLRRELADKRLFPAIDAVQSGTRREEMLMGNEELEIVWKLRRTLSDLEPEAALELLLGRLRKSQTNIEFLRQVQQTGLSQGLVDYWVLNAAERQIPVDRDQPGTPRLAPALRRVANSACSVPVHVPPTGARRPGASERTTMKKDIHPDYNVTEVTCTCGATFTTRSTAKNGIIHADVCSQCHPFYTGKQKILDTGGRVARFEARYAKKTADASERPRPTPSSFTTTPAHRFRGAGVVRLSRTPAPPRRSRHVRGREHPGRRARRARAPAVPAGDARRRAAGEEAQPAVRRADGHRDHLAGVEADRPATSRPPASWGPTTPTSPPRPSGWSRTARSSPSGCAGCWCPATRPTTRTPSSR